MSIFSVTKSDLVLTVIELIGPLMPEGLDPFATEHVAKAIIESQKNPYLSEGAYLMSSHKGDVSLGHADTCLVAAGLFADRLAKRVDDSYVHAVGNLAEGLYRLNAHLTDVPSSFINLADHLPDVVIGLQYSALAVTSQSLEERYAHLLIGNSNYQT